ncbi:sushi domain-containing protein 2-like [Branchiostoma floridae]|uniref:Sushi domain-containing protein 2-like n=1 Tax=Branchiostoma floridae TaxID=7739 RepID=A0A9J7K5X1_BRAFL|nr:sushi domain-containing protein 2-like [Branchiostoma floridae]
MSGMAPFSTFQALLLVLFAVPSIQQTSFRTDRPLQTDWWADRTFPDFPDIDAVSINSTLYPYGQSEGDTFNGRNDDGGSPRISISFSLPYFDRLHDSLWVNTNGVISLLGQISQFTPDSFPLGDGRRLIAPFWCDVDTNNGGFVMYRETTDTSILERATTDITSAFPDQPNFRATWVFVATWHEVAYYGSSSDKRNTFQAVLVSNGRHSFAMFNYGRITWTTGTASDGDAATGLGGTPAQVGFNAGNGMQYFSVPGSQTHAIVDVETTSNVNIPGRWVFRIDSAVIQDGGCNAEGSIRITPFFGTMLGGTKVKISGPCFDGPDVDIRCRFGTKDPVTGWVDGDNTAACISPFLSNPGRIPLLVSTDGGNTYNYSTMYTAADPDRVLTELTTTENDADETITLEWQPSAVEGNTVNVFLHAYNETTETWDAIAQLASNVPNTGSYTMSTADGWIPVDVVKTGALSVAPGNGVARLLPAIVTGARLLYAGIRTYLAVRAAAASWCAAWCEFDKLQPDFIDELSKDIPCPTTLNQARRHTGAFMTDKACKSGSRNPLNCLFHPGAHHCVRSINKTSQGAGQQCCYKQDGSLLLDGPGRGTPDRVHSDSRLGHFGADVAPYFLCCILSNNCDTYFEKRPANDGTGYVFPRPTRTFGDPHFITLDGLGYTFNGHGEFVLLTVNDGEFLAQARMEQLISDGSAVDATIITALAMKENSSETVQVQLSEVRTMDVLVDGQLIDFQELTVQEFSGFVVTVEDADEAQISFNSGIGVTVNALEGMLSIAMTLPFHMRGNTAGLLGVWNADSADDLTRPDGTVVLANSSMQDIHNWFGLPWMIDEEDSLFTYGPGESYNTFSDVGFTPAFEPPSVTPEFQAEAEEVCGKLITCGPLDPPDVPGNLVISNYYFIGSVATFDCEVGLLTTPWERVCQPDTSWSEAPPPACECTRPYLVRHGMCIRVVPRPRSYASAVAFCQNDQGELLSIRDPAVMEDLKRRLLRRGRRSRGVWIGLTDSATEGTWTWEDGVAYEDDEIPGNSDGADCAYMAKRAGFELRVQPCEERKAFICKR